MLVRECVYSDIYTIIPLLKRCMTEINESYAIPMVWKDEHVQHDFNYAINDPSCLIAGAFKENDCLGLIVFDIGDSFHEIVPVAMTEKIWHSDPRLPTITRLKVMQALLTFSEGWAKKNKVNALAVSVNPNNAMSRYLEKQGYGDKEICYRKQVI